MEISQGIVTELDVKTSSSYAIGEGNKTRHVTSLKLGNGSSGWLGGSSSVPIDKGDEIVIVSKITKGNSSRGNKIQAFYNVTQDIQKPDKRSIWFYGIGAALSWALTVWSFDAVSGSFFIFLTLGIFLTVQTYQKARVLNTLKAYLNENPDV